LPGRLEAGTLGGAGGAGGAALALAAGGGGFSAVQPASAIAADSNEMPGRQKFPFATRYSIIPDLNF
jgi:hypothetical protein